jgi:hypothetical protein
MFRLALAKKTKSVHFLYFVTKLSQYLVRGTSPTIKSPSVHAANVRDNGLDTVQPITAGGLFVYFLRLKVAPV